MDHLTKWRAFSPKGRQASTAMHQRTGIAARPCAAPSSAPQIAAFGVCIAPFADRLDQGILDWRLDREMTKCILSRKLSALS